VRSSLVKDFLIAVDKFEQENTWLWLDFAIE
jgi:hypothetical protein